MKNGLLRILNDLDSVGRGGRRDEEEGGTGGKKRVKNEKVVKKMKNEKVAKGRIIGLAGPCFTVILGCGRKKILML